MKLDSSGKPYHLCFETLANELRIKIIDNLRERPMSVEELSKRVHAERSRVSHSLKMLRDCSYVDTEKKGKERIYSLKTGSFEAINDASRGNLFNVLDEHVECYCNNECKKLKARA